MGLEWIALPDWSPQPDPKQKADLEKIEEAYRREGALVKNRNEMIERLNLTPEQADLYFTFLFADGRLVKLTEETYLHAETYQKAVQLLRDHFAQNETLTLAQFRDLFGSARKQVQALLEHFDSLKYTRRVGDERVAWKLPDN